MNGSPSAACAGNSSLTLKSLNEVKKKKINDTTLSCLPPPHSPIGRRGQINISEGLESMHMSLTGMRQFPC